MAAVSASYRPTVLALVLVWVASTSLLAQATSKSSSTPLWGEEQSHFTLKPKVDRVVVDVVVNDSSGKPVRGLTKRDFSIYEDGKRQEALSFDVHSLDSATGYFA